MQNNKMILNYCPNFNKIINTDFLEGDSFSIKLVNIYKDYIFSVNLNSRSDINDVITLDKIMGKYVDDYFFRNNLKKGLLEVKVEKTRGNIIRAIVNSIIDFFKTYQDDLTRTIYVSKWI